jgi:hypothetical protein
LASALRTKHQHRRRAARFPLSLARLNRKRKESEHSQNDTKDPSNTHHTSYDNNGSLPTNHEEFPLASTVIIILSSHIVLHAVDVKYQFRSQPK